MRLDERHKRRAELAEGLSRRVDVTGVCQRERVRLDGVEVGTAHVPEVRVRLWRLVGGEGPRIGKGSRVIRDAVKLVTGERTLDREVGVERVAEGFWRGAGHRAGHRVGHRIHRARGGHGMAHRGVIHRGHVHRARGGGLERGGKCGRCDRRQRRERDDGRLWRDGGRRL